MLFFILSAVINAITSVSLAIFVYFQNPKEKLNQYFSLFAISVALWSTGYFAWQTSRDAETATIWLRILMAGASFIPIFYFHFVTILLKLSQKLRIFLIGGYLFAIPFVPLAIFTNTVVNHVAPKLWFLFWPQPGVLFHVFLFIFFMYAIYSWHLLIQAIRNTADHNQKNQLLYIFWGTLIGFLGGSTNYFLWYNIPIPPIGNLAVAIYVAMIGLAILKTQLFDIRVVLTQILVGVISTLLFINFVLSETFFEYSWKGGLLFAFLAAGYLLVKSVLKEIKQREELQQAYRKLEELDRAKTEFVSIASHQLRTPLTAIKGYISLIMENAYGKLLEKQKMPMQSIYNSNERLIRLVNDLLSISRIESGKVKAELRKDNLQDAVQGALQELDIKAKEKNLQLTFQNPKESLPPFLFDQDKIRNVVMNIVDNAIKYTSDGSIAMSIEKNQKNNMARITIKDTGEGMSHEEIEHLFESFSRGNAGNKFWSEGSGLGLYIAKEFVLMHKGKIWAESAGKGKGSTFFIEIPVQ